jgi:hypothetical protein
MWGSDLQAQLCNLLFGKPRKETHRRRCSSRAPPRTSSLLLSFVVQLQPHRLLQQQQQRQEQQHRTLQLPGTLFHLLFFVNFQADACSVWKDFELPASRVKVEVQLQAPERFNSCTHAVVDMRGILRQLNSSIHSNFG